MRYELQKKLKNTWLCVVCLICVRNNLAYAFLASKDLCFKTVNFFLLDRGKLITVLAIDTFEISLAVFRKTL